MLHPSSAPFGAALLLILAIAGFQGQVAAQSTSPKATQVFGQADFTSGSPNRGSAVDANTLHFPLGIAVGRNEGGIFIADRNNHRVLRFPPGGDTKADRVYGQHGKFNTYISNFDGNAGSGGGPTADTLSMPTVVTTDGKGGIYIDDRENHRILFFAGSQTTATRVYGQFGKFNTNPVNNDGTGMAGIPGAETIGVYSLGLAANSQGGLYVGIQATTGFSTSRPTTPRPVGSMDSSTTSPLG